MSADESDKVDDQEVSFKDLVSSVLEQIRVSRNYHKQELPDLPVSHYCVTGRHRSIM